MLFQNPRIPLALLARHYPEEYGPYNSAELSLDEETRCHLKHRQGYQHLECALQPTRRQMRWGKTSSRCTLIPDYSRAGRVFEIGCAAGNRLALLKQLGWESCIGNEYSQSAATKARGQGLEVITGSIETAVERIPNQSLNAIVGGYVIEHVTDPFCLTHKLAAKLKPGGQFLFSTINIETLDFWLYGPHWFDLDLPRHMVFFRKQDLRAMLSRDFEIEDIAVHSSLYDYLVSANYRMRDGGGGWRRWLDSTLLHLGPRLIRPLNVIARAGFGARFFVKARKK